MWINAVSQAVHQKEADGFLHMVRSKGAPKATGIQTPTSAVCVCGGSEETPKRPPCLLVAQARPDLNAHPLPMVEPLIGYLLTATPGYLADGG